MGAAVALGGVAEAQVLGPDAALSRNPLFASFMRRYPADWESRVHPAVKPVVDFQRAVGTSALIFGYADEEPNPRYRSPRFLIYVGDWDQSDLFAKGLPRTRNGKPVVIADIKAPPRAAAFCDKARPVLGGMSISNRRTTGSGTLGGAAYGRGAPTNQGWKYALSAQHVMADEAGNQAGDVILQPAGQCVGNDQIGSLIDIPWWLRLRYFNADNPNQQDTALAPLTDHFVLSATISGIGNPAGSFDPPQNGWCGNKSGAVTGVTQGCINGYPSLIQVNYNAGPGFLTDSFYATNFGQGGDSGSLWLDFDRRVHGTLVSTGTVPGNPNQVATWFGRWWWVQEGWNVNIATN